MKQNQSFTLIDGLFSVEDAKDILLMLFNYKIDYHNREDFSNHIRFNKDLAHSQLRITELMNSRDKIMEMLEHKDLKSAKLIINSTITVRIE
mgnify:FL=1